MILDTCRCAFVTLLFAEIGQKNDDESSLGRRLFSHPGTLNKIKKKSRNVSKNVELISSNVFVLRPVLRVYLLIY